VPLPSEADIQAAIGYLFKSDATLNDFLSTTATTWITREQTFLDSIPSDASPAVQQAAARRRAALDQALRSTSDIAQELLTTYARVAGLKLGPGDFFDELTRYMIANAKTVKNRAFSYGTFAAGSPNVGAAGTVAGAIIRLTKDENNLTIESGFAEAKKAECIRDANTGAQRHQEVFRVAGAQAGKDALELIGTGRFTDVECLSPQNTASFVPNASFENVVESGGVLSSIVGWTAASIGNVVSVTSDYYRDNPLATTQRCLRFSTNTSIYIPFTELRFSWPYKVPLYAQLAFKRESSCDGNLKLTVGNVTLTVALAAQSGWTIARWPATTPTTSAWFKNWDKAAPVATPSDAAIKIELESRTTGTLLIDDLIFGPYAPVDGAWVALVGGTTPFLKDDIFTVTDTSPDTGLIQTIFARRFGRYLPHTSGAATWADPA